MRKSGRRAYSGKRNRLDSTARIPRGGRRGARCRRRGAGGQVYLPYKGYRPSLRGSGQALDVLDGAADVFEWEARRPRKRQGEGKVGNMSNNRYFVYEGEVLRAAQPTIELAVYYLSVGRVLRTLQPGSDWPVRGGDLRAADLTEVTLAETEAAESRAADAVVARAAEARLAAGASKK